MADPQRRASSSSRYYSPRKLSEWQQIDDHYNRLNAVADDNLTRNESMLNDECHAHQLGFLRRTDIPADVGEKLRELLVENRDLRIDSLRRDYNAMKKDRLEDKKMEEREMFARMGPGNSEPKLAVAGTPFASPSISEGSPVPSPRNEEKRSPAFASTPMPSSIPEPNTPKHATQPPLGYRSSPLNPASGIAPSATLTQYRTPLSQQPNNLPRPGVARNTGAAIGSTVTPLPTLQSTPLPPQPTTKDHLQAQQASQRAAQALAQVQHAANSGMKPARDTPPSVPPPTSSRPQQQAFPSPQVVPSQGITPILSSKKRKPEAVDDHTSSGPDVGSDRNKRSRKSDGARTIPTVNIPPNRIITFEDVHQGGDPAYMHTIVKWEDENFYTLFCEEHGVHFRQKALTAAAKHLDSIAHGNMGRFHHMALEKLGYRISDCDDQKRARHNAIVAKAFDNGYLLPSSESLLNPDKARPAEKSSATLKSTDTVNPIAAENASLDPKQIQPTPQQPGYDAVRKGPHHTKLGKRKSLSHKNLAIITNPVPGELYHATPKPRFGDRPKKYIVMILAWKDLAICSLPGRTLGQLELIQQAKRKTCYNYDAEGISGWMPEYQDDGKLVKKRWFPVIWFEGTKTADNREGWVRAEELSNFDLYPVPKRGQHHPEIRAREWYWRSHPDKAPDGAGTSKARPSEKASEMQQRVDGTSTADGQVEDPDTNDVDDTESDSEPAEEAAPARRGPLPIVDHASDSDYHASDDAAMAESVTSSQASPPPLPLPLTRKSNPEVRSKAIEAEHLRPVTPVRAGAAAGTRSSTKKQAVERDVDMEDAPSLVQDELSPLGRRAKDSGPENQAVLGQAVAVTPQTVRANPSVQLGTPLDKKLPQTDVMAAAQHELEQQEGSERSAKQQTPKIPEAADCPSDTAQEHDQHDNAQNQESAMTQNSKDKGTQGVVDQALSGAVDQAHNNIATETMQELVDEVADKGRVEHGEKPHDESSHGKPSETQQAQGQKVNLPAAGHNSDTESAPASMTPTPGAQQANVLSSSVEATGKDVDSEKTKQQPQEPVEKTVPVNSSAVDGRNGGVETPVEATASRDKPPNVTSTNGRVNSASPNGNADIDHNAAQMVELAQAVTTNAGPRMADPNDRWRAVRTSNSPVVTPPVLGRTTNGREGSATNTASTSPALTPAPAPAPVKNPQPVPAGSGSGPMSEPGSKLSTPVVQTPPAQSPRLPSTTVKRDSEVGGVVWQVSALQQGNRRWSDATHTLRLVVDEAGVAKTSDSDEMDAAVDPQAIQSVHYSQSADKSRAEVILTPMKGSVEQKLTFTVGAGRNKMQSFKFVRWLRQANPDITLVDGPVLG